MSTVPFPSLHNQDFFPFRLVFSSAHRYTPFEPSERYVAFFPVESNVVAITIFIIIIHDLIVPNSDEKYYAVGVVSCDSQKKKVNCYRRLVSAIKLFTMDLTFSSRSLETVR